MDNSAAIIQQLQKENTALKEKNKTFEECLSIVAHDLRNPLNTAMLANELGNKQTVQESLECLNQIIERLLSAPKLEGENLQLALEPFNLKEFLRSFSETQRPLLEKAKIQYSPYLFLLNDSLRFHFQIFPKFLIRKSYDDPHC